MLSNNVAASIADIGELTQRQMKLLYTAALKKGRRERAARIIDTSAGFNGGDKAQKMVRDLSK